MTAEQGWFADPRGASGTYRWWDGGGWTGWLTRDPAARAPEVRSTESPGAQVAEVEDGSATTSPITAPTVVPTELAGVRTPVAVLVTILVLVAALVAVGITITATADSVTTGPPIDPPAADAGPVAGYDASTRTASVDEMSLTLPAAPWSCATDARRMAPYFSSGIGCSAVIHREYVKGASTYGNVALGVISDDLTGSGDLRTIGERTFTSIRQALFSRNPSKLTKFTSAPTTYGPRDKILLFTGTVTYDVKNLPSTSDSLQLVVVKLENGGYGAVFANRANDTAKSTREALGASLETFGVR